MPERTVTIASSVGLHARPASIFVQKVSGYDVEVLISKVGEEPVDASSILGVMALGAKHGEEVVLTSDDPDSEAILDELVALLATDLDAE